MRLQAQGLALTLLAALPCGAVAALAARRFVGRPDAPSAAATVAVMAGLFAWAYAVMPTPYLLGVTCALTFALVLLAQVDRLDLRLPDPVTLPLIAAGLAVTLTLPDPDLAGHAAGAALGFGAFALIAWGFERWRGFEGLGLGDAKLAGAAGAWVGWQALPSVILIACAGGIAWALLASLIRRRPIRAEQIPFGAPLCLGLWLVWLYGPLQLPGPGG